jgi:predicted nucleic acid-binding protein
MTSQLSLAEVLVAPLRKGLPEIANTYRELLSGRTLRVESISGAILERAAELRAQFTTLKLGDAIHAATALLHGCTSFITNDSRFEAVNGLPVVLLSKLTRS